MIKCPFCKKDFLTHICRIERAKNRKTVLYCSLKCSHEGRARKTTRTCITCSKEFTFHTCQLKSHERKYCSNDCFGLGNRSSKNYLWKGSEASYRNQHRWVERRLGKASHCVECGLNKIPEGMKRYFQWANISKKYLRDISDYKSLCVKCHKFFDKK